VSIAPKVYAIDVERERRSASLSGERASGPRSADAFALRRLP